MSEKTSHSVWGWIGLLVFSLLPLVTAAVAALLFTFRSTLEDDDVSRSPLFWWGVGFSVFTLLIQIAKTIVERRAKNKADRDAEKSRGDARDALEDAEEARATLTFAMKDALQQLAEAIAEMPHIRDPAKREAHLRFVAKYGVDALYALISPGTGDVRANVFGLIPTRDGLVCVESSKKRKPAAFLPGSPETQEALDFLNGGERIMIYPDLTEEQPKAWGGRNGTGYKTFMSLPIAAPDPESATGELKVYGMVSIDAPTANSFRAIDEHTAELVADLLATAFAIDDAAAR